MNSILTEGIEVSVENFYQEQFSNPLQQEYMFAYKIVIENHNNFPVKLLEREWNIFDSIGNYREVKGEGVIGMQPIILPGEQYQYVSGCNLKTEMGKMHGRYKMMQLETQKVFFVDIPAFEMIAPFKYN